MREREREMGLKKFDDDKVQTPYIYDERIEFGRITCWGCLYISIKNQSCHSFASCGCCELVNKWSCASQGGSTGEQCVNGYSWCMDVLLSGLR